MHALTILVYQNAYYLDVIELKRNIKKKKNYKRCDQCAELSVV